MIRASLAEILFHVLGSSVLQQDGASLQVRGHPFPSPASSRAPYLPTPVGFGASLSINHPTRQTLLRPSSPQLCPPSPAPPPPAPRPQALFPTVLSPSCPHTSPSPSLSQPPPQALSLTERLDSGNGVAITPDGRVRLAVDKEVHQRMGITGVASTSSPGGYVC